MFVNAASYFLLINYHFHFTTNSYYSFLCDQICVKIKKIFKKILRFQWVTNESHKMLDSMTEKCLYIQIILKFSKYSSIFLL